MAGTYSNLGIDLLLDDDGDLVVGPDGDLELTPDGSTTLLQGCREPAGYAARRSVRTPELRRRVWRDCSVK
jgi:hypothetical protein